MVPAFGRVELTRHRIPDNRVEPIDDMQPAAGMLASCYRFKGWSNTDKSADDANTANTASGTHIDGGDSCGICAPCA